MKTELQGMNEKITTMQSNWETTTIKLQELNSEIAYAQAQVQTIIREWERELNDDRALVLRQSRQVEKVESTLGEIQNTQSTLIGVMEKIQNHVMQGTNKDDATSVDETLTTSEPIPLLARVSKEQWYSMGLQGGPFRKILRNSYDA